MQVNIFYNDMIWKFILIVLLKKFIATWLLKKHCLVSWPSCVNGLLISIINRENLIDSYNLQKGDKRLIKIKLCSDGYYTRTVTVRIISIGTLEYCMNQFSEYACPSNIKIFHNFDQHMNKIKKWKKTLSEIIQISLPLFTT